MNHWYVPGVLTSTPTSLPRAKNLSRESEHRWGTSHRDPISFAYPHIKSLVRAPDGLKNYLHEHTYRIVFLRLKNSSIPNYQSLAYHERLDLALTEGIITNSIRTLIYQIEFEKNPKTLISVFLNFFKEIQKSPLEFQPTFNELLSDRDIFRDDEDAFNLNRGYIRVL